jgi:hypothetical protein
MTGEVEASAVLVGHGRRRGGRGSVAGQVASQAGQLLVGARRLSEADTFAVLLERQPALAARDERLTLSPERSQAEREPSGNICRASR